MLRAALPINEFQAATTTIIEELEAGKPLQQVTQEIADLYNLDYSAARELVQGVANLRNKLLKRSARVVIRGLT